MERKEKGGGGGGGGGGEEREVKKHEVKLKRSLLVGKNRVGGGPSTPSPTWRLDFSSQSECEREASTISARKLCASLWEIDTRHLTDKIRNREDVKHKPIPHDGVGVDPLPHAAANPHDQPSSASSLRRHVPASPMKYHQRAERNAPAAQPASPSCYSSSSEVARYSFVATPSSSLDLKGRKLDTRYNLKTSTELLKVLNRIWTLEEQHVSNMSLMKALKIELDRSHTRFKELMQEKKMDRREMDELMEQVAEDKLARKSKEQDRIKAAVKSVRDELEDEKMLRKHFECLHKKLARDLSEMKTSFSNALKELESERNTRILLENMCDEFAKGVRDYEQEVRKLKHQPEMEHTASDRKSTNRLILHISEAWLDERMQTNGLAEKNRIVDKLSFDIETFLQATRSTGLAKNANEQKQSYSHRHSLDSFPLHEAGSAPKVAADEENSSDSDSQCFELNKNTERKQSMGRCSGDNASEFHVEELKSSNSIKKRIAIREISKHEELYNQDEKSRENEVLSSNSKASGNCRVVSEPLHGQKNKHVGACGLNANHGVNNLAGTNSLSSEGEKIHPEIECKDEFCTPGAFPGHASPVQQWTSRLISPDFEKTEPSLRENSLKAKLLEARLEGRRSRSKASS